MVSVFLPQFFYSFWFHDDMSFSKQKLQKQTKTLIDPDVMPSTLASPHVGPHHAGAFLVQHSFEVDYLAALKKWDCDVDIQRR